MALNFASNNSLSAITTLPASISGGAMTLISEQTASNSATIDFTSNIDSTYDSYIFKYINCHPIDNSVDFLVNFRDGGSLFDATKTTTFFNAELSEADSSDGLRYRTAQDLAQSTAFQPLTELTGNRSDESVSGYLQLFNPSSTTFVKHFIATNNNYVSNNYSENSFIAGYCNTTTAIDGVQFKFASGNIDSGVIKLYGIS